MSRHLMILNGEDRSTLKHKLLVGEGRGRDGDHWSSDEDTRVENTEGVLTLKH